jgi:chromate transport protein ChrA
MKADIPPSNTSGYSQIELAKVTTAEEDQSLNIDGIPTIEASVIGRDVENGFADADNKQEEDPLPSTSAKVQMKDWLKKFGFQFEDSRKEEDDIIAIPPLSYWELFKIFFWFGCRAFGGPVAQIAMMKQELIIEQKWISLARFNRVYSVYQVLPGPEATELACYFGYMSSGRFGAFLGGLGFVLPGCSILLFLAWLYKEYGLSSPVVNRSFTAVQITVAAMIFRATYKLSEGTMLDKKTKELDWNKGFLALFAFLTSVIKLNFFITLGVCGLINTVYEYDYKVPVNNMNMNENGNGSSNSDGSSSEKSKKLEENNGSSKSHKAATTTINNSRILLYKQLIGYLIAAATIGFFVLYCELNGVPSGNLVGGNAAKGYVSTDYSSLFVLGLIAGCVTFGGAYTTLPFIYSVAVISGQWLTDRQFLDAIAITNMLPTPLVSFVIIVGFIGHSIGGSILMGIGIFLPAFSFTIIGHEFFQAVVDNKYVEPYLDGIASAIIGLLAFTCFQFLKSVISQGLDAVVFLLAFSTLFTFTNKYTQPITLIVAAIAGQVLY